MAKRRKPKRVDVSSLRDSAVSGNEKSAQKRSGKNQASPLTDTGRSASVPEEPRLIQVPPANSWSAKTWGLIAAFVALIVYSYWPTFLWIVENWINEPDYGHGWLVIPLVILLLKLRWHSFPGASPSVSLAGLSLIVLAIGLRIAGRFAYADFLDAYSVIPLIAGATWCLLGLRALWWALPAILFLVFAVPLPFQLESTMSWSLQGVATKLSTFFLSALGYAAVSEGHIVWLGEEKLVVEEACSGLRIFVGMIAFAWFWGVLSDRHWSDRLVIALVALPAAVLVNSLRIVAIGVGYSLFNSASARRLVHDWSGYSMIAASFLLLGAVMWYWKIVYKKVPIMTAGEMLRSAPSLS